MELYTDGAARGNPGPAAWAYVAVRAGEETGSRSEFLGTATNNVAEYHAVLNALRDTQALPVETLAVISDSELVVKQLRGEYRVRKEHLASLYRQVKAIEAQYSRVTYTAVPRDHPWITRADRLCNRMLDDHLARGGGR